jgi:hypothetical protein
VADTRTTNVLTVDVEEYYHGVEFGAALDHGALTRLPSRVAAQTFRLLDLLDAHGARGTFFTLGVVARHHRRLVRGIAERGHEIASHGWDHTPVFRLGAEGFRADVQPRPPMSLLHRFRHYVGLTTAAAKLAALLAAFRITTLEDALAPVRVVPAAAVARAS